MTDQKPDVKSDQKADQKPDVKSAPKDETVSIKQVKVLIIRGEFTQVSDTVFEHELRILRAVHGDDFVRVIEEDTVEVANFDANDELARLKRKYRSNKGDPVGKIYQNDPRQIAREVGVSVKGGPARKPAASVQSPAKKKVIGRK